MSPSVSTYIPPPTPDALQRLKVMGPSRVRESDGERTAQIPPPFLAEEQLSKTTLLERDAVPWIEIADEEQSVKDVEIERVPVTAREEDVELMEVEEIFSKAHPIIVVSIDTDINGAVCMADDLNAHSVRVSFPSVASII